MSEGSCARRGARGAGGSLPPLPSSPPRREGAPSRVSLCVSQAGAGEPSPARGPDELGRGAALIRGVCGPPCSWRGVRGLRPRQANETTAVSWARLIEALDAEQGGGGGLQGGSEQAGLPPLPFPSPSRLPPPDLEGGDLAVLLLQKRSRSLPAAHQLRLEVAVAPPVALRLLRSCS